MSEHQADDWAEETEDVDRAHPAAPGSALSSLRARRKEAESKLYIDLPVQRYDPPIYVRFKPAGSGRLAALQKRTEKSKDPDKDVIANATLLAEACVGIFDVNIEGDEISIDTENPEEEWPRFDKRLGALLGVEVDRAVDAVRVLYMTDGDVISTSLKVTEWSGYATDELEEREQGN